MIDVLANDKIKTIMSARSYPREYYGGKSAGVRTTPSLVKRRPRSHKDELSIFIADLPQGASVLDVGCGEGRLLRRIREQRSDIRLYGLDISDVGSWLPSDVVFAQGSAEDLAALYTASTFDAVICQHIIEHLVSPLNLISGIRTVLRPGGKVFMETPNWTRLFMPFSFLYFWNDYTHIHPYTSFGMRRMLLEHGFVVDLLRTLPSCKWRFPVWSTKLKIPSKNSVSPEPLPSAHVYTQKQSSLLARGISFFIDPLIKDLLIAVGTKN